MRKIEIEFFVPGPPVGKERARVSRAGAYTPAKTKKYERHVRSCAGVAFMQDTLADYNPDGWFVLDLSIGHATGVFPDADNVVKAISDALSGVVWTNDKRVIPRVWYVGTGHGIDGCGVFVSIRMAVGGEYRENKKEKAK